MTTEKLYAKVVKILEIRLTDDVLDYPRVGKPFWSTIKQIVLDRPFSLKTGLELLASEIPREKFLGAALLEQLCNPVGEDQKMEAEQIAQALIVAAKDETHTGVLTELVDAMQYTTSQKTLPTIIKLSTHPDPELRRTVADSIGMLTDEDCDYTEAIKTLITLTEDKDKHVRDWATFSLGTLCDDIDSEEIRLQLLKKTRDRYSHVVQEAYMGLALRKDERARPLFIKHFIRLAEKDLGIANLDIESAGVFADPELLPALQEISKWWDDDNGALAWALARCNPDPKIRDSVLDEFIGPMSPS